MFKIIIGLTGQKGSGKDTVAAYLIKNHGFERKSFADPLKKSVAALLDIPFSDVDKFKNDDTMLVGIGKPGEPEYDQWITYCGIRGVTFREFLQRYGYESHRNVFGDDFWLDHTLPVQGFYAGRKIVITDVRFDNEADRIRQVSDAGYIVQIDRPGHSEQDLHRSESGLDRLWDYKITNNATIEDLYQKIEAMLYILNDIEKAATG